MEKEVGGWEKNMLNQECGVDGQEKKTQLEGQKDEIGVEGKEAQRLQLDKKPLLDKNDGAMKKAGGSKEMEYLSDRIDKIEEAAGGSEENNMYFELRKIFRKNEGSEDVASGSRKSDKVHFDQQNNYFHKSDGEKSCGSPQKENASQYQNNSQNVRKGKVRRAYFECYTCHFKFRTKRILRDHVVVHAIPCLVCNNQYFSQESLDRHLAKHPNEIPFHCNGNFQLEVFNQH